MSELKSDLSSILNRHSRENNSDTPDWILAEYMLDCLEAFERATRQRTAALNNVVMKKLREAKAPIEIEDVP